LLKTASVCLKHLLAAFQHIKLLLERQFFQHVSEVKFNGLMITNIWIYSTSSAIVTDANNDARMLPIISRNLHL